VQKADAIVILGAAINTQLLIPQPGGAKLYQEGLAPVVVLPGRITKAL